MLRTAAAFAALSLSAGLYLAPVIAQADPLNDNPAPILPSKWHHLAPSGDNEIYFTNDKSTGSSLVNRKNGRTITLEMVKNDVEWQEETAEMLRKDQTSEAPR